MESYLMMLYVTLEQESALKNFFIEHGWAFCKPDLSVVTDKLGPVTTRLSIASEEIDVSDTHSQQTEQNKKEQETQKLKVKIPASSENTGKQRGKRKTCSQRQPIKFPKQAKVVPSTSVTEPDESDKPEETAEQEEMTELNEVAEEQKKDTNPTKRKVIVEMGDGRQIQIKIERERRDMVESEGVGERQDKGEQEAGMIDDAEGESSDGDDAQTDGENAGDAVVKSEIETAGESSISRMELTVDDAAPKRNKKRARIQYDRANLLQAYKHVIETGASVCSTAKMFKVPESTLRDRVNNKIRIDAKLGCSTVLNGEEEATLMSYLVEQANLGYGFTQKEIKCQASCYAIELGKRAAGSNPFSNNWYFSFVGRCSEKDRLKSYAPPKQISLCKSKECTINYYSKLNEIVKEHSLDDTPENIYIMDEVDIDVPEGEKCNIVSVIGAGNAAGQKIPPYFVLVTGLTEEDNELKRISQLITHGMKNYLENHFIKHVQRKHDNDYVIVLYDAHRLLLSVELVHWAKRNNILLFVMPPHTSHIVKECAEGVFQKVKSKYDENYGEVSPYKHLSSTTGVVSLVKKIYETEITEATLKRSFSRSGIFPLQDSEVMCDFLQRQGVIC